MAIIKEYPKDGYKKQGDGTDSWLCIHKDSVTGKELTRTMVYENPFEHPLMKQIKTMKPEEIAALKQALK